MSLGARRHVTRRWTGWLEATSAWGDPVDLVRALTPLPGVVVVRHWGRWRSEAVVGIAGELGAATVRLALARRLPEPGAAADPVPESSALEGWLEASAAW
jgi:hypothetical protein